jgi:hypothetical protein
MQPSFFVLVKILIPVEWSCTFFPAARTRGTQRQSLFSILRRVKRYARDELLRKTSSYHHARECVHIAGITLEHHNVK